MSRGASFVLRPFGGTTLYRINGRSVIFIPAMALGAHPTLLTTGAPFLLAIGRTAFALVLCSVTSPYTFDVACNGFALAHCNPWKD